MSWWCSLYWTYLGQCIRALLNSLNTSNFTFTKSTCATGCVGQLSNGVNQLNCGSGIWILQVATSEAYSSFYFHRDDRDIETTRRWVEKHRLRENDWHVTNAEETGRIFQGPVWPRLWSSAVGKHKIFRNGHAGWEWKVNVVTCEWVSCKEYLFISVSWKRWFTNSRVLVARMTAQERFKWKEGGWISHRNFIR